MMAEAGTGYVLCLDGIVNTAGDSALCFRPLTPTLKSHVDVVWKKNQLVSRAADLLLAELRERA